MTEPKILVLTIQPTYAFCMINGKKHVERFPSPLPPEERTKEKIRAAILERMRKKSAVASASAEPVDLSTPESVLPEFSPEPEADSKSNKKSKL